jgi:transcriptional regulator with XRE-family HTH domain
VGEEGAQEHAISERTEADDEDVHIEVLTLDRLRRGREGAKVSIPNHELGERIKQLRLAQNLTLKQLEAKARVSATHLSEIERGLTSPTVGALARVARALGEEPALLVAERAGSRRRRVAVVRRDERRAFVERGATLRPLGSPVDGAEMSIVDVELSAEGADRPAELRLGNGEEFLLVLAGTVELDLGATRHLLAEGDAIHVATGETRWVRGSGDAPSRLLWISLPAVTL